MLVLSKGGCLALVFCNNEATVEKAGRDHVGPSACLSGLVSGRWQSSLGVTRKTMAS